MAIVPLPWNVIFLRPKFTAPPQFVTFLKKKCDCMSGGLYELTFRIMFLPNARRAPTNFMAMSYPHSPYSEKPELSPSFWKYGVKATGSLLNVFLNLLRVHCVHSSS